MIASPLGRLPPHAGDPTPRAVCPSSPLKQRAHPVPMRDAYSVQQCEILQLPAKRSQGHLGSAPATHESPQYWQRQLPFRTYLRLPCSLRGRARSRREQRQGIPPGTNCTHVVVRGGRCPPDPRPSCDLSSFLEDGNNPRWSGARAMCQEAYDQQFRVVRSPREVHSALAERPNRLMAPQLVLRDERACSAPRTPAPRTRSAWQEVCVAGLRSAAWSRLAH